MNIKRETLFYEVRYGDKKCTFSILFRRLNILAEIFNYNYLVANIFRIQIKVCYIRNYSKMSQINPRMQ